MILWKVVIMVIPGHSLVSANLISRDLMLWQEFVISCKKEKVAQRLKIMYLNF